MKKNICLCFFLLLAVTLWSAGNAEAAGSATRGKYLAGQGIIIPENEVYVDSYIAQIDYKYPSPKETLGVSLYTGHRQISASGQQEVIQIGIQARELVFEQLPPMNLAFVIDHSGSMGSSDKLVWVKRAFSTFIEQVRDIDFVSLVIFDDTADLIFPSTRMDSREKRLLFKQKVEAIVPVGGTNLTAGLKLGYQQVFANYRKEYTNRVLFLTDGQGESTGILEMAETYRAMGVNVSTIGVGTGFDLKLMTNLAKSGGGSSRFISDHEEMMKTFGTELDRMVVPAARNLQMTLEFLTPVEILDTWGYDHHIENQTITYSLPTLHHRDYETILVRVKILPSEWKGDHLLARFSIQYEDESEQSLKQGPLEVRGSFVSDSAPLSGFSNGMVLRSGTMMRFALGLKEIAVAYYSTQPVINKLNELRTRLWQSETANLTDDAARQEVKFDTLTNPEIQKLEEDVAGRMRFALERTLELKKELSNVKLRLDDAGFDDELGILDNYLRILGSELKVEESGLKELTGDLELPSQVSARKLNEHAAHFLNEMVLDLQNMEGVSLAVSGFTTNAGQANKLTAYLGELSLVELKKLDNITLIEREKLAKVLELQKLALSDLMDTTTAIQIGKLLSANYILTGSVIEMSDSVVVFGRIINVETAGIESVAQVILDKNKEVKALLGP